MKKRILSLLLCVVMLLPVLCGAAMADSEGQTGWVQKDGEWYYYDADGSMHTGWLQEGDAWYYFAALDVVNPGTLYRNRNFASINSEEELITYYADPSGKVDLSGVTEWLRFEGSWFYYLNGRRLRDQWLLYNGEWYYLAPDMLYGICETIDGVNYVFTSNGTLSKGGWVWCGGMGTVMQDSYRPDGHWYYANSDGTAKTGWIMDNGKWYFLDPARKGAMVTGWLKRGSSWYYMYDSGAMATGWYQSPNGVWYYLDPTTGAMATSWTQIGGKWYLFRTTSGIEGSMLTGWYHGTSGNWYYLDPASGAMVIGTKTIDGKTYTFNSNGVWIG